MAIRTFNSVGGFSVGENPTTVVLANGDITTGNGTFSGTVQANTSVKTDSLLHLDGSPWDFQQPAGSANGQIQYYYANGADSEFGASANFVFDFANSRLDLTGNASVTGNVTSTAFIGNLQGAIIGNITASGSNTEVQFNDQGNMNASSAFTFNKSTNALTIGGNVTSLNANLGNLVTANYYTGTLTTAAQPNVTSLGTLIGVTVTGNANVNGNINAANLGVSGRVLTTLKPSGDTTLDLGESGNKWKDVYLTNIYIGTTYIKSTGNVLTTDAANIANNLSAGTLTSRGDATLQANVTVAGDLTVGGNTTYINVTTLSIKDPLISLGGGANGANAPSYDGKDRGLVLHNYDSGGAGPVNQALIWKTGAEEFQAISIIDSITNEVVTASSYANMRAQTFIGNVSGNIITAVQSNITTVGTLSNLVINGNLQVNNTANLNALKASGLSYPTSDGTLNQVLSTDGAGVLSWQTINTAQLSNGNSNVSVYANSDTTISANGVANVFRVAYNQVTSNVNVSVAANLAVTTNTTTGNLLLRSYYPNGTASGSTTAVKSAPVTTSGISANQAIATFSTTGIRGAEFIVKGEEAAGGKYSVATVLCVHDSAGSIDYSVYGTVLLGGTTGVLAVNIVSGNIVLGVTPSSSNSTVWTAQYRTI